MGEIDNNSNSKTSILIARNTPVALVVGAAGFLGSHLVESLLKKNIQVIGVDDFSAGTRTNLKEASKDKNFHLLSTSAADLSLDLPRLDYIFVATEGGWKADSLLQIFEKFTSRMVLVSAIEIYERHYPKEYDWFAKTESQVAKFAHEKHLNARILRLAPVFGPRMHFRIADPATRLIQAALRDELQKEAAVMEFSTRALYIDDAIDLMVKSMFVGATALKIFDGALLHPLKVSEIKQVLMDPLWYETQGFEFSLLPPWPTPNLEKTINHLSWKPKAKPLEELKKTLSYFKENEIAIPEIEQEAGREEERLRAEEAYKLKYHIADQENKEEQEEMKHSLRDSTVRLSVDRHLERGRAVGRQAVRWLVAVSLIGLIFYALAWPVISFVGGAWAYQYFVSRSAQSLKLGKFDQGLKDLEMAGRGLEGVRTSNVNLQLLAGPGLLKNEAELVAESITMAKLTVDAMQNAAQGIQALYLGLRAVTGEERGEPKGFFVQAQSELDESFKQLARVQALLEREGFEQKLPNYLKPQRQQALAKVTEYSSLVEKGRAVAVILPEVVALEGKKSYLVLLQNNNELRPTGGFIGSFAKVEFEDGRLKKFETNDIYNIDGQLKEHVEPPKEIKEDLGQKDWYLRDSNFEPDFPTSARQAEWFFNQEIGGRVEGVVALDLAVVGGLLQAIGGLEVIDYEEKITTDNLFEKAITYAESDFFPGSQAKKGFLTALTNQLFTKLFFMPNQNWPGVVEVLSKALEQKHLLIYLDNPRMFSYLAAHNWAGALQRESEEEEGTLHDFVYPVEANFGANKANFYLERSYLLETVIGKEGEVAHRLKINYTNRSPSEAFPAGSYKNRLRVYTPLGAKLKRVIWGDEEISSQVVPFVDYGRSGFSMLLTLPPKQTKGLILEYEHPRRLNYKDGKAEYKLLVQKQPGTLQDPLEWKLTYPINLKLEADPKGKSGPQQYIFSTNLSSDRLLQATFSK